MGDLNAPDINWSLQSDFSNKICDLVVSDVNIHPADNPNGTIILLH